MTRWAPARKQTSMKNKSTQATFGNPDHSYRFLLAKEMGFEIYHGICLRVWYYLSICYQQGCIHFSQGHVGGMMKPCLCPASLHQCDHCHTQPLCRAQWVGHRRTSGLTLAVKSLEVSIYCSLQVRRPSQQKVYLKSKPPWAQWLLWFQRKAAGFLLIRSRRGTAPRTHGSSSVLPRHEGGPLLLIQACL